MSDEQSHSDLYYWTQGIAQVITKIVIGLLLVGALYVITASVWSFTLTLLLGATVMMVADYRKRAPTEFELFEPRFDSEFD